LFTVVFLAATAANTGLIVFPPNDLWGYLAVAAHAVFLVRVLRARRAAAQQRAVDLETFTALRSQLASISQGLSQRTDMTDGGPGI
jgi:hypothetical protein